MTLTAKTIAIVGSGAIGLYYGSRLALAGADVRFLMRRDLPRVRERGSVLLHVDARTFEVKPARAYGSTNEIGPVDVVIVALKATANPSLPALLPPLMGPDTQVLTLQNGLGADEFIAGIVGERRVLGGLAFIASTRTGPGEVSCYHPGWLLMGEFAGPPSIRTRAFAAQSTAAGVEVKLADNLLEARWRKLIWNVPFNGLAVAYNVTTDVLCSDPRRAGEVRELMRELQHAAGAFGFVIPDEFLEQQFNVTPGMGAYQPSSLVDFRAGREVEVEAIWGEPLRRARAKGVAAPLLEGLYETLKRKCAAA